MCKNNYVNIQNGELLDTSIIGTLKDNAMLKTNPELWCEWDFEKNDELGLDIYDITKGSDKLSHWICLDCNSSFERKVEIRTRGQSCPYCTGRKVNHTNSLRKTHPDLIKYWNFNRNIDSTPDTVSKGMRKKVWWICYSCNSEYEQPIYKRTSGRGCPYCAGHKINATNSFAKNRNDLMKEWHPTRNSNINPNELSCGSGVIAWWKCENNPNHVWNTSVNNRNLGTGCPYCIHNPKVLKGVNDLWTTHPEIASTLLDKNDGFNFTEGSNSKVKWICDTCSHINVNAVVELKNKVKSKCNRCSDKLSFGEKIIYELLLLKNIDFNYNIQFDWSNRKRYDFYFLINNQSYIIEVHGIQHYDRGFEHIGGRSLEEEQANDKLKYELAKANGIDHYIVIDARESNLSWIKKNIIKSILPDIINISVSEINKIEFVYNSITKSIWELWNRGFKVMEIVDELKISKRLVRSRLTLGNDLNKCHYNNSNGFANINCNDNKIS